MGHLHTVPFENLGIHLGVRVGLDEASLLDTVVSRRYGGFCHELNGALALLLLAAYAEHFGIALDQLPVAPPAAGHS